MPMCSGTDHPAKTPSELTAVTLHFFATGDQFAHTVLWEAGVHLGTGIATIFDLLNPGAIVLGGEVPRVAKSFLLKPLFHCFHERTFHRSVSNLKALVSRLGGEAGAVGAAIVIAENFFPNFSETSAAGLTR
jgi:predicted NBD/HSP70 family sugar kinase